MVDIEQNGVEETTGSLGVKPAAGRRGESKEIGMDKAAAGISRELPAQWHEAAAVPANNGFQSLDDEQGADAGVIKSRDGRVTQAQAADHDIVLADRKGSQAEIGKGDLDLVEEAGHEKGVAEFHLENLDVIEGSHAPAAEGQLAKRGMLEVEFCKFGAHLVTGRDNRPCNAGCPRLGRSGGRGGAGAAWKRMRAWESRLECDFGFSGAGALEAGKGCANRRKRVCWESMGHNKGKDNVKKRAARRKKTERLAAEKAKAAPAK